MNKNSKVLMLALSLASTTACATADEAPADKTEETDAPIDGKLDGSNIVDQGPVTWEPGDSEDSYTAGEDASFTSRRHAVAWTFSLSDTATVSLSTTRARVNDPAIDTVMYLYEQGATGAWGRYIERNDDISSRNFFSALNDLDLGVGTYRVVVKGYSRSEVGAFSLSGICDGPGCAEAPAADFATAFNAVKDQANYVSESDYAPVLLQGTTRGHGAITLNALKSQFGAEFAAWFTRENEQTVTVSRLAYDDWTAQATTDFVAGFSENEDDAASQAAWVRIQGLLAGLTDVHGFEVGVKDDDGSFDPDNPGLAALVFVGRDAEGKIVGFYVGAVWT